MRSAYDHEVTERQARMNRLAKPIDDGDVPELPALARDGSYKETA